MKKSSLLLLSLVAVLTACNKNTGPNDWFAQQRRGTGLSNSQKNAVISMNQICVMVTKYKIVKQGAKLENGIWKMDEYTTTTNGFTRTTLNFDKKGEASVALGAYLGTDFDQNLFVNQFVIGYDGSKYVFANGPTDVYSTDAKQLYFDLYDSVFEWGVSFLCGAHQYLGAKAGAESYIPQALLDVATNVNLFTKSNVMGGTTYQTNGAQCSYVLDTKSYTIVSFKANYVNHRLNSYSSQFKGESLVTETTKNFFTFTTDSYSIQYVNL